MMDRERNRAMAYLWHMRPKSWPVVMGHMAVGFFIAHGSERWAEKVHWGALAAGAAIWGALLNGGTLALNTAFDKDEGDIGYLDNPPPIPPGLWGMAIAAMVLGLALAPLISMRYFAAYAICFVMSCLYSVPPVRLKAVPGFDLLINCTGYGMLTMYAGYAAANRALDLKAMLACGGFFCLFGALYPLTQIYQHDADKAHGDRTFTVLVGKRRALLISFCFMVIAFLLFGAHAWAMGPSAWSMGLVAGLGAWCAVLVPWLKRGSGYSEQRGMYRALWAWAATDAAVALNALLG